MNAGPLQHSMHAGGSAERRCLACGTKENMRRRKYCSIECRQRLRDSLNMRTGLLKALQTKCATFYFTNDVIIMDVLPWGAAELSSFIFPRTDGKKPVEDFCTLSNLLGNAWWAERRRTNKRYLASRHVFDFAQLKNGDPDAVKPVHIRQPARLYNSLTFLKLRRKDLESPNLTGIIKSAYRRQALKMHPDHGGTSTLFRRLQKAYSQLVDWADNPVFTTRRGFPDKWFYDGYTNRWVQPTPMRRVE